VRASLLTRLETQLDGALRLVEGRDLERRPAGDKWSAREVLAHLARYHEVFLERVERIFAEDHPRLDRYRAEADPVWPGWRDLPVEDLLARLTRLRAELCARLEGLADADLARVGVHPNLGPLAMTGWIEFFLLHEAHHLYQVVNRALGND
jgi:hypothetical protein